MACKDSDHPIRFDPGSHGGQTQHRLPRLGDLRHPEQVVVPALHLHMPYPVDLQQHAPTVPKPPLHVQVAPLPTSVTPALLTVGLRQPGPAAQAREVDLAHGTGTAGDVPEYRCHQTPVPDATHRAENRLDPSRRGEPLLNGGGQQTPDGAWRRGPSCGVHGGPLHAVQRQAVALPYVVPPVTSGLVHHHGPDPRRGGSTVDDDVDAMSAPAPQSPLGQRGPRAESPTRRDRQGDTPQPGRVRHRARVGDHRQGADELPPALGHLCGNRITVHTESPELRAAAGTALTGHQGGQARDALHDIGSSAHPANLARETAERGWTAGSCG